MTNRDILHRRLEVRGHDCWEATNGREALDIIREQEFDIILLDILMPEMTGFEVLTKLKNDVRHRDIPVIMISALEESEIVVSCIKAGAEDYLSKPFDPVLLRARIGACLEKKHLREREVEYLEQIKQESKRVDELLHVILPRKVVSELKKTNKVKPRRYNNVAVMFADIVGFTDYCDRNPPERVVKHLQSLVETWEEITLRHKVQKIKTIGDAIMAASGLMRPVQNPVLNCVRCGLDMIAATRAVKNNWDLRVGIHFGNVVAGVIGKRQYLFDLWGDTVNTAARMQSNGEPGGIALTSVAWKQIDSVAESKSMGLLAVKGKGMMEVYQFQDFKDRRTAESRRS